MITLVLIFWIVSLQIGMFNSFTVHQRKDGSMFSVIPSAGLVVIIWDPTGGNDKKAHDNVGYLPGIISSRFF